MKMFRQINLFLCVVVTVAACNRKNQVKETPHKEKPYDKGALAGNMLDSLKPFYHGVASGDPSSTSVIIWTRVTPEMMNEVDVWYEFANDKNFKEIVKSGVVKAVNEEDYTVKVDIHELEPDTYYYYRFKALGGKSITGRTHTLPQDEKDATLIFTSCSNYSWGYFYAYDAMSKDTVDAIVHLGDYIYEHGKGTYSSKKLIRDHVPGKELVTLKDYRTRYSQYRLDPGLMRAHQMHPFITIWDDHELANNAYVTGAQNHQPEEGDWAKRKNAAMQAYYEWLPVREFEPSHLYRAFDVGKRVKLVMIDNRMAGRTVQVKSSKDSLYNDPVRALLGKEQFAWSLAELKSGHTWKVIGNPVLFGELKIPGWGNNDFYMDGWDGYPVEKHAWVDSLIRMKQLNILFMTGDFHSSLALKAGYKSFLPWNEFVVPSISSGNYDEDHSLDFVMEEEKKFKSVNKNLSFVDLRDHGYVKVRFSKKEAHVNFIYVSSVTESNYSIVHGPSFTVTAR
ncbi:MAG: alkaline phosphatase D family protein [Flavobacteriales bacterium]